MYADFIIFHFIFSIILLFVCKKFNILADSKLEVHKKFSSNHKSFLIGGIFLIVFLNYYYLSIEENVASCMFYTSIFFIGLMSDLKRINSAILRFLMQLIMIICFVNYLNIEINYTKIVFVDEILKNSLVNMFFVSFCLMVLINGSNFIDGINCNTTSYFLIVLIILLINFDSFIIDKNVLINLIIILATIMLLNAYGILYLGDSGSYTLSLFLGVFLINFSSANNSISPYFIIVLLWYPCFELLFSMIRRSIKEIKTYEPDTYHLHHLIYKKFKTNSDTKNNLKLHLFTSGVINFYNCICFIISLKYIYYSEILIFIILINIIIYIFTYNVLKNNFTKTSV